MSRPDEPWPSGPEPRRNLLADCRNCFGLCCVALAFTASADFAMDKDAGEPCRNLEPDFRCGIHGRLRTQGFAGCTVYDCFGAGQQVSQVTFGGRDWRQAPDTATRMFQVFPLMRQLHELLWYLGEALTWSPAAPLHSAITIARETTLHLTAAGPAELLATDVAGHRQLVDELLKRTSELVRGTVLRQPKAPRRKNFSRADLIGAKLAGADLRGADLRGAYLIGADLRGADLRMADLIGADLRAAELAGADLSECIFLTQFQLNAANGNAETRFPAALSRPGHWVGP